MMNMKMFVIVFACLFGVGCALKCYQCNSQATGQEDCTGVDVAKLQKFETDCGANATVCRKMTQSVFDDTYIIRQCSAVKEEPTCIDRVGTYKIKVKFCHCKGDLCNSASQAKPFYLGLLVCPLLVVLGRL